MRAPANPAIVLLLQSTRPIGRVTITKMPQHPEPAIRYEGYSDLYFATEQQIRSQFSIGNYDRGELSLSPGRLTFRGMRVLVDCSKVTAVRLVRKSFPWGIVATVGMVGAVLLYLKSPVPFTLRQPIPYIILVIFLAVCIQQSRLRWVEVAYTADEQPQRAYFRREPIFGGSGVLRTQKLYKEIEDVVLRSEGRKQT